MEYSFEEGPSHRVVVGIDGSACATRAAVWAATESLDRGVPLTLVHALHLPALPLPPLDRPDIVGHRRDAGATLLERESADLLKRFPELRVEADLSDLSPAQALNRLSSESALLVTGSRGYGGYPGMLLGSVSSRLAAHAHCPYVVVPDASPTDPRNEVVVGLKPGDPDTLIRFAFTAAERYGAKLQVVRAWSPHDALYPLEPARAPEHVVTASVEDLLRPLEPYFPGVETQITAARAHPVTSLVEASRGARLVIVGRRHRGPLSVGAGTVVDNLLEHSHAPVAIVPPPE